MTINYIYIFIISKKVILNMNSFFPYPEINEIMSKSENRVCFDCGKFISFHIFFLFFR